MNGIAGKLFGTRAISQAQATTRRQWSAARDDLIQTYAQICQANAALTARS